MFTSHFKNACIFRLKVNGKRFMYKDYVQYKVRTTISCFCIDSVDFGGKNAVKLGKHQTNSPLVSLCPLFGEQLRSLHYKC